VVLFVDMALSDIIRGELASLFPLFLLTPIQIPRIYYQSCIHKTFFFTSARPIVPFNPLVPLTVQDWVVKDFARPYMGISFVPCPLRGIKGPVSHPSSTVHGQGKTRVSYGACLYAIASISTFNLGLASFASTQLRAG